MPDFSTLKMLILGMKQGQQTSIHGSVEAIAIISEMQGIRRRHSRQFITAWADAAVAKKERRGGWQNPADITAAIDLARQKASITLISARSASLLQKEGIPREEGALFFPCIAFFRRSSSSFSSPSPVLIHLPVDSTCRAVIFHLSPISRSTPTSVQLPQSDTHPLSNRSSPRPSFPTVQTIHNTRADLFPPPSAVFIPTDFQSLYSTSPPCRLVPSSISLISYSPPSGHHVRNPSNRSPSQR